MEHLDIIIAPLLTGLGLLATFWGITYKLGESMDKKVKEVCVDQEQKRANMREELCDRIRELALLHEKGFNRVYERFDEYKKNLEGSHVRKEVCEVMHKQLVNDVNEVKKDVKELLKRSANGKQPYS